MTKFDLASLLKEGDTVYTLLTHVSKTGLTRYIKLYTVKDNQIVDITYEVAEILGWKYTAKGMKIDGVGTDVGFQVVYNLSWKLFGDGYKLNHKWL